MKALTEEELIDIVADLLNRAPNAKEREQRVRNAHRRLFACIVEDNGATTKADLALARAAALELRRRQRKTTRG